MRFALLIISIVFSILQAALPGHAQSRVALVIGNSAYRNTSQLQNTENDATDIAASFQRLGFSVKTLHNATFDDMRRALLQFGRDARGSEMAVVYFAGHGMEVGGENWLIPVDAELRSDRDVENEAISLKSAMLQVANATGLGLVILDSCRDNPFAAQMQRVSRSRAVDRGLARVEPTDNVLVAYAAKDGTVASDGRGRNSPFTTALLNNLEKAGIEIRFLLATVRDEVLAATNRQQQPFVYGSLSPQPIYLKPPAQPPSVAAASPPSVAQPLTEVERAWTAVQASPTIAAMEAFVRRFGDSFYADLAKVRIEELKRTQAGVAPPAQNAAPSPTPATSVAPQGASPTGGPCGSRAVVSLDPCLSTQQSPIAPTPQVQPAPTAQPTPASTSRDRLLARLAAYSVPASERESLANRMETEAGHKAIAVSTENHGTYLTCCWTTGPAAEIGALEGCQLAFGKPCAVVVVDDPIEATKDGPPILRDMPRTRYAGLFDPGQIPRARPELLQRVDVTSYRSAPAPKAVAFHHQGRLFVVIGGGGQFEAEELALSQCNEDPFRTGGKGAGGPCFLYAVGDQVVLPQRSLKPLTPRQVGSPSLQQAAIPLAAAGSPASLHDRLVARLTALSVAADEAENRARDYEAEKDHKAIAVGARPTAHYTWRQSQWPTDEAAVTATLEKCQVHYGQPCTLVAVGDKLEPASGGPPVLRDMPRTRYNGQFDPEQIPGANGNFNQRADVASYRSAAGPKAAAYHPWGRLFIVRGIGQFEAEELALKQCNDDPDRRGRDGPCFLYAVGDQVVLTQRSVKPLSQRRADQPQTQQVATAPQAATTPQAPNSPSSLHDRLLARFAALSVPAGEAETVTRAYETGRDPKSIAVAITARHTYRATGRSSQEAAISSTLEGCQVYYGEPCSLVAVGDKVEPAPVRDMPRTQYTGRFEPERVPSADGSLVRRADVTAYRSISGPKAAAYNPWGLGWLFIVTGAPGQFEAEEQVLAQCNDDLRRKAESQEGPCFLYAVGAHVVLSQRLTKPRPKPETIREALNYLKAPGYSYAYFDDKGHKAIAFAPERGRTFRWSSQSSAAIAEQKALEGCQLENRTHCVLLASDDTLQAPDVWKAERHDMPRLNYKGRYAPNNVPLFSGTEDRLHSYSAMSAPKAMVIRPAFARVNIATGASLAEAQSKALAACNDDDFNFMPCFVYAVNDRVILDQRRTEPLK
jgi:Caspase domain